MSPRVMSPKLTPKVIEAAAAAAKELDADAKAACVAAHKIRLLRRKQLDVRSAAIKRATDKYEVLDQGENPEIRIRRSFVRLAADRPVREDDSWPTAVREKLRADVATRPPLTTLIQRPGNALQVYLSMLYIAQLEFEPGIRWVNDRDNNGRGGWGELAGLFAPAVSSKELNLRLTRALIKLADHDLVLVREEGSRNRFDGFTLLREDERQAYFAPSPSESRSLPAAFFRAGWHLVLTNEELATLLAIIEQTAQPRARRDAALVGVALPQTVRWRSYGLASEAFAARHELEEFGLIDMFDPMDRTDGKLPDSQRQPEMMRAPRITLKLDGFDFSRPAIEVVKAKLADPVPPRMVAKARGQQLLDNNGRWRESKAP